jgi:iron(III) transport system substrate-binding protein
MKKRIGLSVLVSAVMVSLMACGGGSTATTAAKAAATTKAAAATTAVATTKAAAATTKAAAATTKAAAATTKAGAATTAAVAASTKKAEDYKGSVVVYSPHDADPLNAGVNSFMKKYPNVKVEVVAAGTGELCNRIKAESAHPVADVLWGGGADSLAAFKDYFDPYVCANDKFIDAAFKDPDKKWIGESPLPMVIMYNKKLLKEANLTAPASWEDCTKPEFKGKVAYCLPSKSGSAFTQLCTMLFAHGGKEDGWKFVESLYKNLDGKILDSSGKCHKMVADGEYMVGLTIEKSAILYKDNADIGYCYPSDGTSAVPDGVALVKGAPNLENAKLFIDFVTSKECQTEQSQNWGRRPVRNDMQAPNGLAQLKDIKLVDYDFEWAATKKEDIISKFNDVMVNN